MKSTESLSFSNFKASKFSLRPHYLVVGQPIDHSLSPLMHNLSLRYHSIDAEYIAVELPPNSITDFVAWINNDNFLGCNITIPWKREFVQFPDQLSEEVLAVGAMNTLSKTDDGYTSKGDNTDIYGFKVPLLEYDNSLERGRAIIFGTGGASLAVQYALMEMDFEEIILVSRSPYSANPLNNSVFTEVVDYHQWQSFAEEAELFVNTTPLGMGARKDLSPVDAVDSDLLAGKICYDLIYNPITTEFLSLAESAGAKTIGGLDMLIHQGSRSFEIWTGHTFPIEKVRNVLLNYFSA
ncbi:shikimate dehydrogenase [Rhodohalobacter sp. 8-1]|uniref:shikimate dehydrogenase n=1 Tax=Rhodohalobacter sp. 8-1 TaxID=3131972 RepID=UPI0030EB22D1